MGFNGRERGIDGVIPREESSDGLVDGVIIIRSRCRGDVVDRIAAIIMKQSPAFDIEQLLERLEACSIVAFRPNRLDDLAGHRTLECGMRIVASGRYNDHRFSSLILPSPCSGSFIENVFLNYAMSQLQFKRASEFKS